MKNFTRLIILLALPCCFWACDKNDDTPVSGEVEIVFLDTQKPTSITLFTEAGNEIYTQPVPAGTFDLELNAGNYKAQPYTQGGSAYIGCYFQIVAGRTTRIVYSNFSAEVTMR